MGATDGFFSGLAGITPEEEGALEGAAAALEHVLPRATVAAFLRGEDPHLATPALRTVSEAIAWNTIVSAKRDAPRSGPAPEPKRFVPDPAKERVTMADLVDAGPMAIDAFSRAHPAEYAVLQEQHTAYLSRPNGPSR